MTSGVRALVAVAAVVAIGATAGCSREETASESPATGSLTFLDDTALDEYDELGSAGYRHLDAGRLEDAVAAFTRQVEQVPGGKQGAYNLACAHGRTGDLDRAFSWLDRSVTSGWTNLEHLEYDPDLRAVREDPRFEAIRDGVRANQRLHESSFAAGLPDPPALESRIADEQALDEWWKTERRRIGGNGSVVWFDWQTTAALLSAHAQRLAALRELRRDDPGFDYGLERVRAISSVKSNYERWGALSAGVIAEVDAYLESDPGPEARSEACLRAAVAAYNRNQPTRPEDAGWSEDVALARSYLARVAPGTPSEGAAVGWTLRLDLLEAGDRRAGLHDRVRAFADRFGDDENAMEVAGMHFHEDLIRARWPIALAATDLDGHPVSLDDYRGRVVLIDFWATWCGPCVGELPGLKDAYETFHDRGFDILSVSLDFPDRLSTEQYREWVTGNGMPWRHVYDHGAFEGPLPRAFSVYAIPSPFLIGRDGSLVAMGNACRGEQLAATIERALTPGI